MKYIDLIAYPIMLVVVYGLFGILNWEFDPADWAQADRFIWVVWALVWGFGLQCRIIRKGEPWTPTF